MAVHRFTLHIDTLVEEVQTFDGLASHLEGVALQLREMMALQGEADVRPVPHQLDAQGRRLDSMPISDWIGQTRLGQWKIVERS